jgi:tRNA-binding EMAP/Myf-like protein
METINFDDFKKIDIRVGRILSAEKIEGSDKLLKLEIDFGLESLKPEIEGEFQEVPESEPKPIIRQIIAGIAQYYAPDFLKGKESIFVFNLEPRMLKGLESNGMILCASNDGKPVLLTPVEELPPGSIVK